VGAEPHLATARVSAFVVGDGDLLDLVKVELTCIAGQGPHRPGEDTWAVRTRSWCLNRDGEWEHEPIPSSRTAEFFARCRFSLGEALALAEQHAREEAERV
jgi:hypothetical protein